MTDEELIAAARKAASIISFYHAGWDYYDNPPEQKQRERDAAAQARIDLKDLHKQCCERGLDWGSKEFLITEHDYT